MVEHDAGVIVDICILMSALQNVKDMSMIDRIGFVNDFIYGFLTPEQRWEHCYSTYHSIDIVLRMIIML
jgi:hypothetical protein